MTVNVDSVSSCVLHVSSCPSQLQHVSENMMRKSLNYLLLASDGFHQVKANSEKHNTNVAWLLSQSCVIIMLLAGDFMLLSTWRCHTEVCVCELEEYFCSKQLSCIIFTVLEASYIAWIMDSSEGCHWGEILGQSSSRWLKLLQEPEDFKMVERALVLFSSLQPNTKTFIKSSLAVCESTIKYEIKKNN